MNQQYIVFGAFFGFGFLVAILFWILVARRKIIESSDKKLRQRKDQFISLASHYLLNPITIIQSAVASLQERDTSLSSDQRMVFYDAIERGQQRLWIVTEQLILVGEIDQETLRLQVGVSNLYDTISEAIAVIDPFARVKKISLHFDMDTKDLQEARFDARKMKQAIIAVLDNAVKFSLEGGSVRVRLTYQSGIFSIIVEDDGIGMPDSMLSHITEKFYRGTDVYTFDYEGFGLGLHIAQAIIQMHQGALQFVSKPKKGTIATIQFPSL